MAAELTCVIHVHSVHSDGTGTIAEIAAAARAAGAGAVIVTDHDSMGGAGEAGWRDGVLVLMGVEVTPAHGDHLLALGVERPPRHLGRTAGQVLEGVHAAGGIGFAAHPFSRGGWMLGHGGRAAPWGDLRHPLDGIEVWSMVTDTLEHLRSPRRLLRFALDPDAVLDAPPAANLAAWDAIGAHRRMPAFAGLDAHQYGLRRRGRVVVRTMSYARSFALLRTHVLLDAPPGGDAERDGAAIVRALTAGRAFMARDSLADATGLRFGAADGTLAMGDQAPLPPGGVALAARAPRACELRLLRDGEIVASATGARELHARAVEPGVHRVEARLDGRVWALTNAVYLR